MPCTLHSSPSKPLSHLERALPHVCNTLCFLPGTAIQRCHSGFLKSLLITRIRQGQTRPSSSLPCRRSVVGWRKYKPQTEPHPTFATFSHNYYSTTRKHSGRTRLTTSASAAGGLVDRQQYCFMSLPKRSRRSRYRGPACCTTHNYGPICTTHTGRLIQVTVCELDGILSFGPSQKPPRSSRPHPPARRWNKGTNWLLHTTRQPPRHDALRIEPRRPALVLALGLWVASPAMASFPCPGPRPISREC